MGKALSQKQVNEIINSKIKREGKHLVLPADPAPGMKTSEAIKALQELEAQENQKVNVHEVIQGNPFDALASLHTVLKNEYGWSTVKAKETFFGKIPPVFVDVRTGHRPEDVMQCPIGVMSAPGMGDASFEVQFAQDGLHIMAQCKQCQAPYINELAAKVRAWLKDHSIYKGKAWRMPKTWDAQAEFLSFEHANEDELVLNDSTYHNVFINLFTPVQCYDEVKAAGFPFRRKVLLSGDYGTGKSMTMSILAKKALKAGMTVIYLDDTSRIGEAMQNADRFGKTILIAEDLDRIAGQRDDRLNQIINILSGALSEKSEVMIVMTTNHAEKIERVVLRRLEMVKFDRPNAKSVEKLLRIYGKDNIYPNEKLDRVSERLAGQIPSTIKGVVELAGLAKIGLKQTTITEDALLMAVDGKGEQIELLNSKKVEVDPTLDRVLKSILRQVIASSLNGAFSEGMRGDGFRHTPERLIANEKAVDAETVH